MSEIHKVNDYYKEHGLVDEKAYADMYQQSIADNDGFWGEHGKPPLSG